MANNNDESITVISPLPSALASPAQQDNLLGDAIARSIKNSADFYKTLSTEPIGIKKLEGYTIDIVNNSKTLATILQEEYVTKLWHYLKERYALQTKLKRYYFQLESKLIDKHSTLTAELNEHLEKQKHALSTRLVAQSNINTIKAKLHSYNTYQKYLTGTIILFFVCIILLIAAILFL
jgi:hypothetical protein